MMKNAPLFFCWLTLLVSLSACDPRRAAVGDRSVAVDTIGGVVYVANIDQGAWESGLEWALRKQWVIGGADADGHDVFGQVRSVSLGPDGVVYVLDGQTNEILLFDQTGRFVDSTGGRGDGPGELQIPLTLAWGPDDLLWVPDLAGRYTVYDGVGQVQETFARPPSPVFEVGTKGAFDETGAFVDEMAWGATDESPALRLFRVRRGGTIVDTLPPIPGPPFDLRDHAGRGADGGAARAMSPAMRDLDEFRPRLVYAFHREGTWTSSSSELRLIQRTWAGDTLRIVDTNHRDGMRLTAANRQMIQQALRMSGLDPEDFGYERRIIAAMHVHPDGHVLVQIDEHDEAGGTSLDVFRPDGRFLGTMRTTLKIDHRVAPAFRDDTVILVTLDPLDVQAVVRATLLRTDPLVGGPVR